MASSTAEQVPFNPWAKITEIFWKDIADPTRVAVYEYVAPFENERYETTLQAKPEVVDALTELRHYRYGTGFAASLPENTRNHLKALATTGLYWFGEEKPARRNCPIFRKAWDYIWRTLVFLFMAAALGVPIWKSFTIDDEVYFISKISTAVVTMWMFLPYILDRLLVFSMFWKFSETRLIHPLVPLTFVFIADHPAIDPYRNTVWYKVMAGLVGVLILVFLIYLVSIKKKLMLGSIRVDARKRDPLSDDDVLAFAEGRSDSRRVFTQALAAMTSLEKGPTKIRVGITTRDVATFRKDNLSTFVEALDIYGAPPPGFWQRAWKYAMLICRPSHRYWNDKHHPLPKSPVILMEIAFFISQLIIYKDYVASYIDLVTTQSRVTIKLLNIMMKDTEPTDAGFAEFSRLIAGAWLGFLIIGIAFAIVGRPLVRGKRQAYFAVGLTVGKFVLSNYVAPVFMIIGLIIIGLLQLFWRHIGRYIWRLFRRYAGNYIWRLVAWCWKECGAYSLWKTFSAKLPSVDDDALVTDM